MDRTCLIVLPLLLAGCNAAPLDYTPIGDMKSGPGMFSGSDGGYVMRAKASSSPSAEEYREFQEWREWRRAGEEAIRK